MTIVCTNRFANARYVLEVNQTSRSTYTLQADQATSSTYPFSLYKLCSLCIWMSFLSSHLKANKFLDIPPPPSLQTLEKCARYCLGPEKLTYLRKLIRQSLKYFFKFNGHERNCYSPNFFLGLPFTPTFGEKLKLLRR